MSNMEINRNVSDNIRPHIMEQRRDSNFGILSIAALSIILMYGFFVFARELIISFKDYAFFRGIWGSPWVGLKNYNDLVSSHAFGRIIGNTIIFNLLFACMSFGIAFIIGTMITSLPKRSVLKDALVLLFAIPLFIPADVYGSWLINAFNSSLFANPGAMRFLHPFFCSVKYMGIPLIVMHIIDETREDKDRLLPLKVPALFSLVSLAFIMNTCFSLTSSLYNPMTYETMDMADTYLYRTGLAEMRIGLNSAMGVIQTLISALSALVMFVPIKILFSATFKGGSNASGEAYARAEGNERISCKVLSSVIALAVFSLIYFLPYIINKQTLDISKLNISLPLANPIIMYLALSAVSALIAALIAAVAGRAFIASSGIIRWVAAVMLLLITVFTIRAVNISNYLLMREIGAVNTGFAIILSTCFSAAAVWAMACILRHNKSRALADVPGTGTTGLNRLLLLAAIGIFLMQTAFIYTNTTPALFYLTNTRLSPFLTLRQITMSMQSIKDAEERASMYGAAGLYGFIMSLPAIIIFLLARVILPREHLLAIISGGLKN